MAGQRGVLPRLGQAPRRDRVAPALRASSFGTPPSSYIGSGGNIVSADYCKQTSLIAAGFDAVLALGAGQSSTMVEGYFAMPDLNFLNLPNAGGGYYVRFLF